MRFDTGTRMDREDVGTMFGLQSLRMTFARTNLRAVVCLEMVVFGLAPVTDTFMVHVWILHQARAQ